MKIWIVAVSFFLVVCGIRGTTFHSPVVWWLHDRKFIWSLPPGYFVKLAKPGPAIQRRYAEFTLVRKSRTGKVIRELSGQFNFMSRNRVKSFNRFENWFPPSSLPKIERRHRVTMLKGPYRAECLIYAGHEYFLNAEIASSDYNAVVEVRKLMHGISLVR